MNKQTTGVQSFDFQEYLRLFHKKSAEVFPKNAEVQAQLYRHYGIEDHPKRDLCWSLAWEYGHSNGLNEVVLHFNDFVRLLIE